MSKHQFASEESSRNKSTDNPAPADAGAVGDGDEDVVQLRETLAQCQLELAESKNANLRAHADFDNYRKRLRAERDQEYSRGSDRVLADLLPIMDDFDRALTAAAGSNTAESVTLGIEMIYRQLQGLLERYGITVMAADGQIFDPKYHDAVTSVVSDTVPEHTIVAVIQRGYLKNTEVFRPARVAVAVAPEG